MNDQPNPPSAPATHRRAPFHLATEHQKDEARSYLRALFQGFPWKPQATHRLRIHSAGPFKLGYKLEEVAR